WAAATPGAITTRGARNGWPPSRRRWRSTAATARYAPDVSTSRSTRPSVAASRPASCSAGGAAVITLSATLEAAQQAPSGRPDVRLRLFDYDLGVTRLRFTRWHDAAAVDGPTRCAVLDDGTLIRTRIWPATGNLYVSRVTSPGPGSTYTSWTLLDTVHTDALLALSAQGDRVLIATLRADGAALLVYESDDGGQTFGTTTTITGSIASTTA